MPMPPKSPLRAPAAGRSRPQFRHARAGRIALAILGASALVWGSGTAGGPEAAGPFPPATLVDLAGPQKGAVVRHRIEARLEPSIHGLTVSDEITIVHAPEVPTSQVFSFLLWKDLTVESVAPQPGGPGGAPRPRGPKGSPMKRMTFTTHDRLRPRDFWAKPPYDEMEVYENARQVDIRPDPAIGVWPETLRVVVRYRGTVMDSLRTPKAAYQRSFEETAGLIEERGAYLCGASFWIPSRPGDIFTFGLTAYVPSAWRAVSQGAWLGRDKSDGSLPPSRPPKREARPRPPVGGPFGGDVWDCPQPMEEVYLVAGPWQVHEADHGSVKVMAFTYAETDSSITNRYLRGTGRYLDLYEEKIGPYPFAKFALVENFWQTGFGMPSFTLLGDRVIRLPFILDTSYGHEILHNWWGNGVFVDYEKGNWCEGLTTYGADYLYKVREGPAAALDYRRNALAGYLDYVSGTEDMPLSRFRGRHDAATQAIGYAKSMMVIHQLYREAGEERFWDACRDFYRRNLWRRATWDDLLASFQSAAGVDAPSFRKQWIDRPGAPLLSVRDVRVVPERKRWRVQAILAQTLSDGWIDGEPYALTVPVRLRWADRDSTWQVPLREGATRWSVTVDRKPDRLIVDPDFEVMRRLHRTEIPATLSRTLGADSVTVVLASGLDPAVERACRALADSWAGGQSLRVVEEWRQPEGWRPPSSAWYLGLGSGARAALAELPEVRPPSGPRASIDVTTRAGRAAADRGAEAADEAPARRSAGDAGPNPWSIAGEAHPSSRSFVLSGCRADAAEIAWTVIVPSDSAATGPIGEKIPHYGKYSFLVFDGSKVVAKGVWSETSSPLSIDLASLGPVGKRGAREEPRTRLDRGGRR